MADTADPRPGPPSTARLVVVTGMTGAGRSTAAKELEDLGYFVVDNLPPDAAARRGPARRREPGREPADRRGGRRPVRVVLRLARRPTWPSGATGRRTTLLFLDATDDVLVRRQEAARRPHPLQGSGRLLDGHRAASARCWPTCAADADLVIDTSNLNVHQLTARIAEAFGTPSTTALKVTVVASASSTASRSTPTSWPTCGSCPTRTGCPSCAPQTGRDPDVGDYVLGQPGAAEFLDALRARCSRRRATATSARASGS